jgi:RNA polymerase sigma-70 factor (ECF subfamily)
MNQWEAGIAVIEPADDLVALARDDPAAFQTLYETYRLPVYRYLRSRLTSDDDAADLAALTFERAFRSLSRYRAQGSPVGWLLRIARNVATDAGRRRRPAPLRLDDLTADLEPAEAGTPEAAYLASEQAEQLQRLVRRLPDSQRDAVILRYANGLTAREIGRVIGKSEDATQKLITRALGALKEAHRVDR